MASIELRCIRKSYGKHTILHSLDLSIRSGEFIVLVGPSGCGKSTLLRTIAGLEDASHGDILIDGRRVNDLEPKDRNVAMVFQSYALYPHMTVADNMSYALKLRKTPRQKIAATIAKAAETLELTALMGRRPKALSGGQRQRVAMGRAIVREPHAFLFDEPLSNLDARLREQMRAEIKRLHTRLGATSIYVTHDQIEAMTLADRIVVMEGGAIQQIGSSIEVYERPANQFVAGFIGSPAMNSLTGRVERDATSASLVLAGGMRIRLADSAAIQQAAMINLGIRPEHVVLGRAAGNCALEARVELVEPTGPGSIVHARLGADLIKAYVPGLSEAKPGAAVPIALPPDRLHMFDAATGSRIG